jgi:mannose-6-phosphate isomerase-like protein (cupin superfamily)
MTMIVRHNAMEIKKKEKMKGGDVVITGNGASYDVKNTGSVPLVFRAIVVTHWEANQCAVS